MLNQLSRALSLPPKAMIAGDGKATSGQVGKHIYLGVLQCQIQGYIIYVDEDSFSVRKVFSRSLFSVQYEDRTSLHSRLCCHII